jgi:hypothetical protein
MILAGFAPGINEKHDLLSKNHSFLFSMLVTI